MAQCKFVPIAFYYMTIPLTMSPSNRAVATTVNLIKIVFVGNATTRSIIYLI